MQTLRSNVGVVCSVQFHPQNKSLLAIGNEKRSINIWNTKKMRVVKYLFGQKEIVWSVSFSPDGKTLASGS